MNITAHALWSCGRRLGTQGQKKPQDETTSKESRLERQKETGSLETLSPWIKPYLKSLSLSIIWANEAPLMFKTIKVSIPTTYYRKHHNCFSYIKSFTLGLAHNSLKVWAIVTFSQISPMLICKVNAHPGVQRWTLPAYNLIIQFHIPLMASHRQLHQRP